MVIKVKVNGEWIKVPCAVEEAPKDGQQYVRKDGDWSAVEIPEVDLSGIESSIETIETSINELDTNKASKTEVTEQINAAVASVYKVKGSVDSYDALPAGNVSVGDVYNVLDTGANYVAIEVVAWQLDEPTLQTITWDKLSETVDLSNLATKTELSDLTTAVDTAVDELSDKVDTLETSINSIGSTLVTDGDGTQYLANDGTYKTLDLGNADEVYISNGEAPTGNQEIWIDTSVEGVDGYILDDAPSDGSQYVRKDGNWSKAEVSGGLENEEIALLLTDLIARDELTLTQDEADKISSICPEVESFGHAMSNTDVLGIGGEIPEKYFLWVVLRPGEDRIVAYCNLKYYYFLGNLPLVLVIDLPSLTYTIGSGYNYITGDSDGDINVLSIAGQFYTSDGSASYSAGINLITGGDGNSFLSNSGEYKEIPSQSTFSDTSVDFEPSATYTDFPYQSRIALEGVTANDFVEVVFGINEALSGNYAPVCLTEDGYVTIYSKVSDKITIPTIIIHR